MPDYYIGLISGTSIDAIDACILEHNSDKYTIKHSIAYSIPDAIKDEILQLCATGDNEIERMGCLDNKLGRLFAEASLTLIESANLKYTDISAIGSHGQTIRHLPNIPNGFTLQIGNPALIAELTNITTIADFRRADLAAGGQGAPLVPAFHQAMFAHPKINRVIVNIGGMGNVSILENDQVTGFDTGPGNVLLNAWTLQHKNQPYDKDGQWAAKHSVNASLLSQLMADNYFSIKPPKSTGREHFDMHWLEQHLAKFPKALEPGIVQATLTELTAATISNAIKEYSHCQEVYVCGGGAHNQHLMSLLQKHLPCLVATTQTLEINPDYVEAATFAWFAKRALDKLPSNIPAVTGAKHPVILGAIYPR